MNIGIYQIKNLINNKIYIGSSVKIKSRWSQHIHYLNKNIHDNKHLQHAWNKYGADAFEFTILEIINDKTKLIEREQVWIEWLECCNEKIGYNLCKISNNSFGLKRSEEVKKNISNSLKGHKLSEETKRKIALKATNRKCSDKTKIKIKLNSKIRNKLKWPCELGVKCRCKECNKKKSIYVTNWQKKQRLINESTSNNSN